MNNGKKFEDAQRIKREREKEFGSLPFAKNCVIKIAFTLHLDLRANIAIDNLRTRASIAQIMRLKVNVIFPVDIEAVVVVVDVVISITENVA